MIVVSETIQATPEAFDALIDHFRATMLPILRRQMGHHLTTVLTDPVGGTMLLLGQWFTPQDRQSFLDSDDYREYSARSDEMNHVLGGPPQVVVFDLRLQG